MRNHIQQVCGLAIILLSFEGFGVEFEPLNQAIAKALGTTKAVRRKLSRELASPDMQSDVYYSKDGNGKPKTLAFIQNGVYEPNCTHTWVVGVDAPSGKVMDIRVVEMSCPHAFPTRTVSFMGQFKGKGFADLKELDDIDTVAKATGSSRLTAAAVKRSISVAAKLKGSF